MIAENYYDGLIADWYDDWLAARKDDVAFYTEYFKGFSGRILELACGTGRILLPIAAAGGIIDGLDSSADMLKKLKSNAEKANLPAPVTFHESMASFNLPHHYSAIFISSGSFQLLTEDDAVNSCLKSILNHLSQSGFLLLDVFVPWETIKCGSHDSFHVTRDNRRPDGTRCVVAERFEVDVVKQLQMSVFKYEIYRDRVLERTLTGNFDLRWYWKDEMENLLKKAGFSQVEQLTDSPLYKPGRWFVFKASR